MNVVAANPTEAFVKVCKEMMSQTLCQSMCGDYVETLNAHIEIIDPRDKLMSPEGHLMDEEYLAIQWNWYTWAKNDLKIYPYHESWRRIRSKEVDRTGHTTPDINSNYGVYVFSEGQLDHCIKLLQKFPQSRRAVVLLNRPAVSMSDTEDHICTSSLQFLLRHGKVHCITTMRSNELWFGLRNDAAFFIMLQEIVANSVGAGVGSYFHNVGSLHAKTQDIGQTIQVANGPSTPCSKWPHYTRDDSGFALIRSVFDSDRLDIDDQSPLFLRKGDLARKVWELATRAVNSRTKASQ